MQIAIVNVNISFKYLTTFIIMTIQFNLEIG